jgi:hypothetical protein
MIHPCPELPMARTVAQHSQPFCFPFAGVAIKMDNAIREPGGVPGKRFALNRRHANGVEQVASHAAGFKVHKSGRAHVKGKIPTTEEPGASPGLTVRFENNRRHSLGL